MPLRNDTRPQPTTQFRGNNAQESSIASRTALPLERGALRSGCATKSTARPLLLSRISESYWQGRSQTHAIMRIGRLRTCPTAPDSHRPDLSITLGRVLRKRFRLGNREFAMNRSTCRSQREIRSKTRCHRHPVSRNSSVSNADPHGPVSTDLFEA